jgi:hypothetical protein
MPSKDEILKLTLESVNEERPNGFSSKRWPKRDESGIRTEQNGT